MVREVTHDATGPLRIDEAEIDERGGSVMLCRCGLSAEYPFCDASHEATRDEREGRLYRYEGDDRREIAEVVVVDGDEDGDDTDDTDDAGERDGDENKDDTDDAGERDDNDAGETSVRGDDPDPETRDGDRVR
ncbi:CDGSH iron-sulfur domain-containing protein [Salinigranum sp. GCM10025319]|uniref:CDGSH iron-sulfur domain-containing protein n=1 Tax=Salinigranum sp. GCM10025319 TaxID=3252687 RepID=UPI003620449E